MREPVWYVRLFIDWISISNETNRHQLTTIIFIHIPCKSIRFVLSLFVALSKMLNTHTLTYMKTTTPVPPRPSQERQRESEGVSVKPKSFVVYCIYFAEVGYHSRAPPTFSQWFRFLASKRLCNRPAHAERIVVSRFIFSVRCSRRGRAVANAVPTIMWTLGKHTTYTHKRRHQSRRCDQYPGPDGSDTKFRSVYNMIPKHEPQYKTLVRRFIF